MADPPRLSGFKGSFVLVRHGESTWVADGRFQGRGNPPLSELGRQQARLVADRLSRRDDHTALPIPGGPPRAIWHSPLERAATTAQIIAELQPATIELHPIEGLTEIAQGEWEGLPQAEVIARWPKELAAWRRTPAMAHAPGGESLVDAAARVRQAVEGIVVQVGPPAETAASAGSDEAGVAAALAHSPVPGYPAATTREGLQPEPWVLLVAHDGIFRLVLIALLDVPLERFWSFPFNLASITVVALHEGVAALRAHNLSDHLAPLALEDRAAKESRGERRGAL